MTMARPGFSGDQPHKWENKQSKLAAIIVIAIATAAGLGTVVALLNTLLIAPGIRHRSGG